MVKTLVQEENQIPPSNADSALALSESLQQGWELARYLRQPTLRTACFMLLMLIPVLTLLQQTEKNSNNSSVIAQYFTFVTNAAYTLLQSLWEFITPDLMPFWGLINSPNPNKATLANNLFLSYTTIVGSMFKIGLPIYLINYYVHNPKYSPLKSGELKILTFLNLLTQELAVPSVKNKNEFILRATTEDKAERQLIMKLLFEELPKLRTPNGLQIVTDLKKGSTRDELIISVAPTALPNIRLLPIPIIDLVYTLMIYGVLVAVSSAINDQFLPTTSLELTKIFSNDPKEIEHITNHPINIAIVTENPVFFFTYAWHLATGTDYLNTARNYARNTNRALLKKRRLRDPNPAEILYLNDLFDIKTFKENFVRYTISPGEEQHSWKITLSLQLEKFLQKELPLRLTAKKLLDLILEKLVMVAHENDDFFSVSGLTNTSFSIQFNSPQATQILSNPRIAQENKKQLDLLMNNALSSIQAIQATGNTVLTALTQHIQWIEHCSNEFHTPEFIRLSKAKKTAGKAEFETACDEYNEAYETFINEITNEQTTELFDVTTGTAVTLRNTIFNQIDTLYDQSTWEPLAKQYRNLQPEIDARIIALRSVYEPLQTRQIALDELTATNSSYVNGGEKRKTKTHKPSVLHSTSPLMLAGRDRVERKPDLTAREHETTVPIKEKTVATKTTVPTVLPTDTLKPLIEREDPLDSIAIQYHVGPNKLKPASHSVIEEEKPQEDWCSSSTAQIPTTGSQSRVALSR